MQRRRGIGIGLGLTAGLLFGSSGTFGKSLMTTDWAPATVIAARIAGASLLLIIPALIALKGRWYLLWDNRRVMIGYGVVSIAGTQLFFFNALGTLPVSVGMVLEYLSPLLVVLWLWLRHGQRPGWLTSGSLVLALIGLVLAIDLTGTSAPSPVGIAWGLASAACLATYYFLANMATDDLPDVVLVWGGMTTGAVVLGCVGGLGIVPMRASLDYTMLAGHSVSPFVPLLGLMIFSAAVPYLCSTMATRIIGAEPMSFLSMIEVVAAVIIAFLVLGEVPTAMQLLGGLMIVAAVLAINLGGGTKQRAEFAPEPDLDPIPTLIPSTVTVG